MSPPILMTQSADLDAAIRAVPSQRWSQWLNANGSLEVNGSVPMGPGRLVRLVRTDGASEQYATCLAWGADRRPVAIVQSSDGRRVLGDGIENAEVRDALYAFALRGSDREDETIRLQPSATGERSPGMIPASRVESLYEVDYDGTARLELFSPLAAVEPIEVSIARHLTRARCPYVEPLLAVLTVRDLETDATFFLGTLKGRHDKPVAGVRAFRAELVPGELTDRARSLGRQLSELHHTLADESSLHFAPRPITDEMVDGWRDALNSSATVACDKLLQSDADRSLAERLAEVRSLSEQLAAKVRGAAGRAARVHGDLSLKQTQRLTDGRFMFLKFSGALTSPIYDLATLLRSLSQLLDREGPELEREVRAALLNGYFGDEWDSNLLPPTPHRMLSLLQLFELEVAFRQLAAALDEGGDVGRALRGATRSLDGRRT